MFAFRVKLLCLLQRHEGEDVARGGGQHCDGGGAAQVDEVPRARLGLLEEDARASTAALIHEVGVFGAGEGHAEALRGAGTGVLARVVGVLAHRSSTERSSPAGETRTYQKRR